MPARDSSAAPTMRAIRFTIRSLNVFFLLLYSFFALLTKSHKLSPSLPLVVLPPCCLRASARDAAGEEPEISVPAHMLRVSLPFAPLARSGTPSPNDAQH